MANPFLGQVTLVGFHFAPRGWALCNGQLMSIAQNPALFALLGTYYGGNGQTTFGLPNLQGNVAVHFGTTQGGSAYDLGQIGGEASHTLTTLEMPAHTHIANANKSAASVGTPVGSVWAAETSNAYAQTPTGKLVPQAIGYSGNSIPHNNMQPFLVINFIIALVGTFPSRG